MCSLEASVTLVVTLALTRSRTFHACFFTRSRRAVARVRFCVCVPVAGLDRSRRADFVCEPGRVFVCFRHVFSVSPSP